MLINKDAISDIPLSIDIYISSSKNDNSIAISMHVF